jgi:hypothetical protein
LNSMLSFVRGHPAPRNRRSVTLASVAVFAITRGEMFASARGKLRDCPLAFAHYHGRLNH